MRVIQWAVMTLALTLALACGDEGNGGVSDLADAGVEDASLLVLPTTCTGACSTMDMEVAFGATVRSFDRAFFGLTSPAKSESGQWEIYLENSKGDDDACPTVSSPTPEFLMTVAGLQLPVPGAAPATATLVDFVGELLTETVFEEAGSSTVTWVAADICLACTEGTEADRADRMVAFDIDATFSKGSISGHGYATHCDSLDQM